MTIYQAFLCQSERENYNLICSQNAVLLLMIASLIIYYRTRVRVFSAVARLPRHLIPWRSMCSSVPDQRFNFCSLKAVRIKFKKAFLWHSDPDQRRFTIYHLVFPESVQPKLVSHMVLRVFIAESSPAS